MRGQPVAGEPLAGTAQALQVLGEAEQRAATLWLETEPYYEMIPEGCSSLSRKFFISQVRFALELLIHAPSWEHLEEPAASPLPPPGPTLQRHLVN